MGTSGVWRALKTIFPNEKVYDNYGRHYHVESKENRQQMLAAQYFFDCNCPACKEDWPVYRVSFYNTFMEHFIGICITVGRVANSYHTVSRSGAKLSLQIFRC